MNNFSQITPDEIGFLATIHPEELSEADVDTMASLDAVETLARSCGGFLFRRINGPHVFRVVGDYAFLLEIQRELNGLSVPAAIEPFNGRFVLRASV